MKRLNVALFLLIAIFALPAIAETSEQEIVLAAQLNQQAKVLYQQGKYQETIPLLQRALELCEKALGPEHIATATAIDSLAQVYMVTGRYDIALPLLQRDLAIHEKIFGTDNQRTAHPISNLALLYQTLGQYDQALPLFQHALAINEKTLGPENAATATSLNNLALIYKIIGQYDKALPLLQRALLIDEKLLGAENTDIIISLNNLGELYETLGLYDKALPLLQRSLAISEKSIGPEHVGTARVLNSLAVLYETMGQYDDALPLLQRSLAISEKIYGAEHVNTASCLNNIATLYSKKGQYDNAVTLLLRALSILEKVLGPDHSEVARIYNALAVIDERVNHPEFALTFYRKALLSSLSSRAPETLKLVQGNLGVFYYNKGNTSTAIFFLKEAVNTMQSIRAKSTGLDKTLQISLLKKNSVIYKELANLLVTSGRLAEAQQVLAMLKEDEYFDFIRRDSQADTRVTRMSYSGAEKPFADSLDMLGNDNAALVDKINELDRQATIGLTQAQEQQRTKIKAQLADQSQQLIAIILALPQQLPVAQQKQLEQQRAEQTQLALIVQKQLAQLGQGVVLVQYLLLDDKIQILLTNEKQQIARVSPIGEAAMYPKLVALRKALEDSNIDPRPLAQDLYKSLIAPIENEIKNAQTIMLSLDGALRYIPFAALYDGQHYLIERYRLSIYTAAAKNKLTSAPTPNWKIIGLGVTQAHPNFPALPGVIDELTGIVGKHGIPGETYFDEAFTARQMQASLRQGYPVLHLASHFQFTPGTEADSFLLLGDGSYLSLKDIRQGNFPFDKLDLLTLSACATAMLGGQDANGKEVEGFGALAQIKGAKSVLATLWPIADESTAQLMQIMYHNRQQQHMNKAEALRQAQLALLHGSAHGMLSTKATRNLSINYVEGNLQSNETIIRFQNDPNAPFAHPLFWAPFILMGNWL